MADKHLYFAIQDLTLTAGQRQTLRDAILSKYRTEQPPSDRPDENVHFAMSADGTIVIFDCLINEDNLTVATFRQFLANTFSVATGSIGTAVQQVSYGGYDSPVVTFSYNSVDRLRVAVFGGVGVTVEESRAAAQSYMAANPADWNATG